MRYLDPKNDLTFKRVFGEPPHLLRSFLNALLPLGPDQQIVFLEYLSESAFTEGELDAYDRYWDIVQVERTRIADSLAAGEKVGIAKGEMVGLAKGREQGREQGREEGIQEALARLVAGGLPEAEARKMLGMLQ